MSINGDLREIGSAELTTLSRFSYADLSSKVANFLKGQAERIRRQASTSIVNIGKDLIGAKHYLSHGAFIAWVENEIGMPARTAQAYMQVARWAAQKSATTAHLPFSLLYLLSSRGTPEAFINDVLKRIEAGEHIPLRTVRTELRDLREAASCEKQERTHIPQQNTSHEKRIETDDVSNFKAEDRVLEAVGILAHKLSKEDFAQVRAIFTDRSVIDNPKLAQVILGAFSIVERAAENELSGGIQTRASSNREAPSEAFAHPR